jgi:hypothetical protein
VTDGDTYELFDRSRPGSKYEDWCLGCFRLSCFHRCDERLLDMLGPGGKGYKRSAREPEPLPLTRPQRRGPSAKETAALLQVTGRPLSERECNQFFGRNSATRQAMRQFGWEHSLPEPPPPEKDPTLWRDLAPKKPERRRQPKSNPNAGKPRVRKRVLPA